MEPSFFPTPAAFRAWLRRHHGDTVELVVGFHRKSSGKPSITWPEAVDEALCVGWIDGVRRSLDDTSYTIRFTPRKSRSIWSARNITRVEELTRLGRMQPAGLEAFARRSDDRSSVYTYERNEPAQLDRAGERSFRGNREAWDFFNAQAPWYRRTAVAWVMSAKREETRRRRLARLIEDSQAGRSIAPLARGPQKRSAG
jgi:uncharacterized protein YdeI (YjbR/CyaY-like superfamily)